jgi:hypothetical protein
MPCAGLLAAPPAIAGVPRLEPGYNPAGEWLQQWKLCALAAGDGGLPVWFDMLPGGTGESTTDAPHCAAFSDHARLARFLPLEAILLIGDRTMPTADHQLTWVRLQLGSSGPRTLPDHHRQTRRDVLEAGHTWHALPSVAKRESAKLLAQRTHDRGLGHTVTVSAPQDPSRHGSVRHL